MGYYMLSEGATSWEVCQECGMTEDDIKAEREAGIKNKCWHIIMIDLCDDEDCEACNYDEDLWRLGLREKPEFDIHGDPLPDRYDPWSE